MAERGLTDLTIAVIGLAIVFGGSTRSGFIGDVIVQLAAVPLLLWALLRHVRQGTLTSWPLLFCAALALVPVLQIVPLPPFVWTALPLRDLTRASLELAGEPVGWQPLSVAPALTWQAIPALIPATAVLLAVLTMPFSDRRRVLSGWLAAGLLCAALGLLQDTPAVKTGDAPAGIVGATGFFVNRNHFAALCYALIVFAAALVADAARELAAKRRPTWRTRDVLAMVVYAACIAIFLTAIVLSRSRAGLVLALLASLAGAVVAASDHRTSVLGSKSRLLIAAGAVAFLVAGQFALLRVLARFQDPLREARWTFLDVTWQAVKDTLPFGTGVGTFVPVYKIYETPAGVLPGLYVNRAHNELLEVMLETGVIGPLLFVAFALWLAVRFWKSWVGPEHGRPLDVLMTRAAGVVVLLLLVHGLVDYPLRTAAISSLFAFSCALLVPPARSAHRTAGRAQEDQSSVPRRAGPAPAQPQPRPRRPFEAAFGKIGPTTSGASAPVGPPGPTRPAPKVEAAVAAPEASAASPASAAPAQRKPWGEGVQWPEKWRRRSQPSDDDSAT